MREITSNVFLAGFTSGILWHFYMIAIKGKVYIQEPSLLMWSAEVIVLVGIVTFALGNIVRVIKDR